MSNPFDFFEKIYCINLPRSVDRKKKVSEEFRKLDILDRVVFDCAPVPPNKVKCQILPGILGCSLSNLKMIFNALDSGANNFLVFEDDITLNNECEESKERLRNSLEKLPMDWDILYLGGKPTKKIGKFSDTLLRVNSPMLGTYAYAFNKKAAIGFVEKMMGEMMTNACDTILGMYAMERNSFCIYPPLFSTVPGFSFVRGADRNYRENTRKSWEVFGPNA